MPSDLPTTFSPGLFFLEALDYAGYSAECNLLEVFNLIVTSSEFMNSAILPQFIMKRNFTLFTSDLKTSIPYKFCHSLRYVRELRIEFCKDNEEHHDEESSNKKSDERIAQAQIEKLNALTTLVENSGLFGYYCRKLTVNYDAEEENAALMLLRNSLCCLNKLETLVLEMPLPTVNSGQALIVSTRALGKHLISLELELKVSSDLASKFLEPVRSCARLESLTIDVRLLSVSSEQVFATQYEGLDFSWLTADCSLCTSLKRLTLENMADHVAHFRPFANLKKLISLTVSHNANEAVSFVWPHAQIRSMSERMTPDDFKAICVASAETLTELVLDGVDFNTDYLLHLKELPHLRVLELTWLQQQDHPSQGPLDLLPLRDLPCFEFLKKLILVEFDSAQHPHSNTEILAQMFGQMKCLESLRLLSIEGAQRNFNCLDWIHDDAQLQEVRFDISSDVLEFPTKPLRSVSSLCLDFSFVAVTTVARADAMSVQMQQLPILFPNLKILETGFLIEPFTRPFDCLEELTLLSTKTISGNAIRSCFTAHVFPKLRVLEVNAYEGMSDLSVTDVIIWCRDLKKMKYLERFVCRGCNFNFTAESAKMAREYFPFIDYELSDDEYNREYWRYRNWRLFFDEDQVCEDNSNDKNDKIPESEASVGTRRQREDDE